MHNRRAGTANTAHGVVTKYSVRTAKSGNFAHEFNIESKRFSLFSDEEIVPFLDGDVVSFEFRKQRLKSGSRSEYYSIVSETLELVLPGQAAAVSGFVYILSNPAMVGLLKIGYTTGPPEGRAAELSSVTGVPKPFRVEWAHPIQGDPEGVERRAHAILGRSREGKEFFRVSVNEAKAAVLLAHGVVDPKAGSINGEAIAERMTDFQVRRAKQLIIQQNRKDAEALDRFWASPLGQWLTRGSVKIELRSFDEKPEGRATGLVSRLFENKTKDWLSFRVIGRNNYDAQPWRAMIDGVFNNRNVGLVFDRETLSESLSDCITAHTQFSCQNISVVIEVGNTLLQTANCFEFDIKHGHDVIPIGLKDLDLSSEADAAAFDGFVKWFCRS